MKRERHLRQSLISAVLVLAMLFTSLVGTTFAWFTDQVSSAGNKIQAGNLQADLLHKTSDGQWISLKQETDHKVFNYDKWEPGYTAVETLKIANLGSLAFRYKLSVDVAESTVIKGNNGENLADVIDVYVLYGESNAQSYADIKTSSDWNYKGTLAEVFKAPDSFMSGQILPDGATVNGTFSGTLAIKEQTVSICLHMQESAGNEYQKLSVGDIYLNLLATQYAYESDSFGDSYDENAEFPSLSSFDIVIDVPVENGAVNQETKVENVTVPVGVKVKDGTTKLGATVKEKSNSEANLVLNETEIMKPIDVHVEGLADDNHVALIVFLGEVLPRGLNIGNYTLYHVEDGVNHTMTAVSSVAELNAHNEFYYDPATGEVTVAMASFSEVALVADTVNPWEGNFDYSWYDDAAVDAKEFQIANADQLAALGAIVGGMDGRTQDSFKGKTVKLIADINLGDKESDNNPNIIFYPIGYYNTEGTYEKTNTAITSGLRNFEGTFDGNGHTIANFYQNTWEMKGDHNWYAPEEQYYRDGMGLFGRVYGGTVKNLTVKNFSSDGEIATTGVIAAYADGATFENIAIFNCNPKVYNIGNGGIVGCVGWYAKEADLKTTFTNITVDNSNKISALWGSYDVACGGIVGQYYPTSGQSSAGYPVNAGIHFENCHVSAVMDVYNDVCGNYQYYAYRYAGMIIGSIRENTTNEDGKTIPDMTGISAIGCTVNYGDWNDYYYCEFEKNGHPSYSGPDDYKFSRVPHSELNFTDSNGNGLVDSNERASVNGCKHNHTDAENNHAIYLPFHQLFTGYGWGVNSIGLEKYSGIVTNLGISEGDQEASVEKFESAGLTVLPNNIAISVGDLFTAITDSGVDVKPGALMVSVEALDENGYITAVFNRDVNNWENSTITISGIGRARITIQDYYFCTATSFEVEIVDASVYDMFGLVFENVNDYLYRVGNQNKVALESLFYASLNKTVTANKATVTVSNVAGNAQGEYTVNETDWTNGTIKFSSAGVVMVTINVGDTKTLTLNLEVVDAYNVVQYSELKEQNSVLLSDITMSSGGTYRLTGNKVLYGNGFTFDVKNGAYAGVDYDYASYVIYLENSRLDNVKIEGAVYPEVGATKSDNYNRAIVMTGGECSIINSFISNGASPIRNGGDLELVNTTLKGGAYANLDLRNGHLIIDNVTTINQANANDKYNDTAVIVGMGIVVYQEGGSDTLKITIRNGLTQYNYLSETEADEYFTDTYSKTVKDVIFGDDFADYQNNGLINFGIISMNNYFTEEDIVDERSDKTGYFGTAKTITLLGNSRNCYVYSVKPATISAPEYYGYQTVGQGVIAPTVSFNFDDNYVAKTEGSNDYCYAEGNTVYISMDDGDSFDWSTSILTAIKYGETLEYTVTLNGVDYTGKSISFNVSDDYEVTYAYTDSYNYTLEDGTVKSFEKNYTKTVTIKVSVIKADAKNAEFSFGANGTAYTGKTVLIGDKTYVMPDVTATVSGKIGSTTVSGTTVYYPITEMYTSDGVTAHKGSWYACFPIFKDAVQIIDYADKGTGDPVTYNQTNVTTVAGIPSTLKATNPTSAFLYSMNATNYPPPTDPAAVSGAVCYTCNQNGLTASNERNEMTIIAEYTYTDNAGKVYYYYVGYHCAAQTNGCVTPDTLITIADGTQVRVDSLTGNEELLVWNMETGMLDKAPIMFIDSDAEAEYEIVHLYFSDGTDVKVISEHGFWDYDLNKYVYLDRYADKYIGHFFAKQNGDKLEKVQLVDVVIEIEVTTAWSPVTEEHLCYFVNGMLSMPGGVGGLFNIFEADAETMTYDVEAMQKDIEIYGLYTYEELNALCPLSEEMFNAAGGAYLKISIGKGNLTEAELVEMITRYSKFFN